MRWKEKNSQHWQLEEQVAWYWRLLLVLLAMPIAMLFGIGITRAPHSMTLTCRPNPELNCTLEKHQIFGSETTQLTAPILAVGAKARRTGGGNSYDYFIVLETSRGEYNLLTFYQNPWQKVQLENPTPKKFQRLSPLVQTEDDYVDQIVEALNTQFQLSKVNFRYRQRNYFLQGVFGLIFVAMLALGFGSIAVATSPNGTVTIKGRTICIRWHGIRGKGVRIYSLSEIRGYSIQSAKNSHVLVLHLRKFPRQLYFPAHASKETVLQLAEELEQMAGRPIKHFLPLIDRLVQRISNLG